MVLDQQQCAAGAKATTRPTTENALRWRSVGGGGIGRLLRVRSAEEIGAAKLGEYAGAAAEIAEITVRPVCDHRARQGGFDGSASAKLTGPIPQIAMTAGSFWPWITPS
jgi:hypothetical protein